MTIRGPVPVNELGLILPHEHLFVDLRGPHVDGYATGAPAEVAALMLPHLAAAHAAGVTALVECSTIGVGRNVRVLEHLASQTPVHIVAPTGVYREAYIPAHLRDVSDKELAELWIHEINEGIEDTGIRAGFIKIAMSDDGPTALEERSLRAAARASKATGAAIASHTIGGRAARRELDVLEGEGLDLSRFIWVHAHAEPSLDIHREAAQRGAYVEFDAVDGLWVPQADQARMVATLLDAGLGERILLSHDAGWYEPGQPGGVPQPNGVRPFTPLVEQFIPLLQQGGADAATIRLLTVENPARAFGIVP